MRIHRRPALVAGAILLFALTGCASGAPSAGTDGQAPDTSTSPAAPADAAAPDASGDQASTGADIIIPAGAYAASGDLLFPIPDGWAELDPFTPGKLGKDVTTSGSVEYPGDAKESAAIYFGVLEAAGFVVNTYPLGEVTNKASIMAEGMIGGVPHFALLNFNEHADGYQRVSIIIKED